MHKSYSNQIKHTHKKHNPYLNTKYENNYRRFLTILLLDPEDIPKVMQRSPRTQYTASLFHLTKRPATRPSIKTAGPPLHQDWSRQVLLPPTRYHTTSGPRLENFVFLFNLLRSYSVPAATHRDAGDVYVVIDVAFAKCQFCQGICILLNTLEGHFPSVGGKVSRAGI